MPSLQESCAEYGIYDPLPCTGEVFAVSAFRMWSLEAEAGTAVVRPAQTQEQHQTINTKPVL